MNTNNITDTLYNKLKILWDYTNNPKIYAAYAIVRFIILYYLLYNWSTLLPNKPANVNSTEYNILSWKNTIYNKLVDLNDWWEYKLKEWGGYYTNDTFYLTVQLSEWNKIDPTHLTSEQKKNRDYLNNIIRKQNSLIFYNWWIYLLNNADILFNILRIFFFLSLGLNNIITYQELLETTSTKTESNNKNINNNQNSTYSNSKLNNTIQQDFFTLLTIIGLTSICIFIGWLLIYVCVNFTFVGYITNIVLTICILLGLSGILYYFFENQIKLIKNPNNPSWINLLIRLIIYIPCEVAILTQYIKDQYSITSKPVVILLIIESILIIFRFVIPILTKYIYQKSDVFTLLDNPIYLDNKYQLTKTDNISTDNISTDTTKYKYSLSFWFRINPESNNTRYSNSKFTNILNMQDNPSIQYCNTSNTFKISYKPDNNSNYKLLYKTTDIKYQKWNYVVLNYENSILDIFINGSLQKSILDMTPRLTTNNIIIGENQGISGGITDIVYRKFTLSSKDIKRIYKTSYLLK